MYIEFVVFAYLSLFLVIFHKYSYIFHLRIVPQRMVGDDDVSVSNEESSTSITVEVDSKEVELYLYMP